MAISTEQQKKLTSLIDAALPEPETNVHRMDPVDTFLSELTGVPREGLRAKTVSKAGNLNVRFKEPGARRAAFAVITDGDLRGGLEPARNLLRLGTIDTFVLALQRDGQWVAGRLLGSSETVIAPWRKVWPDVRASIVPRGSTPTECFDGLDRRAFDFMGELKVNNNDGWWAANKERFDEAVADPVRCLFTALVPLMGKLGPFETKVAKILSRPRHEWPAHEGPYRTSYWGAISREGRKKQDDFQMFTSVSARGFVHGLYVGEGATGEFREQLRRLATERGDEVLSLLRDAGVVSRFQFVQDDPWKDAPSPMQTVDDLRAWVTGKLRIVHTHAVGDGGLADAVTLVDHVLDSFRRLYPVFVLATSEADDPIAEARKAIWAGAPTLAHLARETSLTKSTLSRMERALERKKQIVLQGPPGTSKTYVALRFAEFFAGSRARVQVVQFHPSYSYEDFIEGIRARTVEVQDGERTRRELDYGVDPGVFKKLCVDAREALKDPARQDERFVLVIDEINRGNVARILGELLFLIEYRDRKAVLSYSGEEFEVPENVYIIATMNTADRSIALVDFALRRRFSFIEMAPSRKMLVRWLDNNPASSRQKILDLYDIMAKAVDKPEYAIGHSHFMTMHDDTSLRDLWEIELKPYLQEYWFAAPTKVQAVQKEVDELLPAAESDEPAEEAEAAED